MRTIVKLLFLIPLSCTVTLAQEQPPPDLTGTWTLQTTAQLPVDQGQAGPAGEVVTPPECLFEGSAQVGQSNGAINGSAVLMLLSGPEGCPGAMDAGLSGGVQGGTVSGNLDGGDAFGQATFDGTVSEDMQQIRGRLEFKAEPTRMAAAAVGGGQFSVLEGPFRSGGGSWSAVRQISAPIPTLNEIGFALLVAMLLASSLMLMRRSATL